MEDLIATYGYVAVFIGAILEGETLLALAGVAAAHGYLWYWGIVGAAMAGAVLGDQTFFFLGRRYGHRLLERFPALAAKAPPVQAMVRRWDALAVVMLRFLYGLRIAGPIVIGTCGISPWRLAFFNLVGAALWAPLVAAIGYFAGYALHEWLGGLERAQIGLLVAVALAALIVWYFLQRRRAKR